MKRTRKILIPFLIILVFVLIVLIIFANRFAQKGLPTYTGEVFISGLEDSVTVLRDRNGTPHIFASNETDLYTAVGYVMAQERLWQMDLLRRVTLGRLSEIFGDDFVETDLLLRSLQYSSKSKDLINQSPIHVIEALEAYANGVNQFIEDNSGNYPLEFNLLGYEPEKWEPYHSINLIGYMAWDLKSGWDELVLEQMHQKLDSAHYIELLPQSARFKTSVFSFSENELLASNKLLELGKLEKLGLDIFQGSNNWAVSGNKSITGKPILANDMHLSFGVPGIWMQMHQTVPGKVNVSGLALPGQPLIIVGHNEKIAWGMTNTYVDNLDYYEEKINPEDSGQYQYNGEWLDFVVTTESIKSSSDSVFIKTYKRTHRGPVVSEIKKVKDRVLSVRWVGDEPSNELLSIYRVNRAGNWDEFKDAFRTFHSISQNIAYADVNGNIGIYACAGVPVRKRDAIFGVLPGWTDEYDWTRLVPFEELPHEFNPERGFVSSANNKTIDDSYPHHIGTWYAMPYRIDRIRELLEEQDIFSIEDFKRIQNDTYSTYAQQFMTDLFPLIHVSGAKSLYKEAYQQFENWDGNMAKDLVAPALFETTMFMMLQNTYKDEMGEELFEIFLQNRKLPRIALFNLLSDTNSVWLDNVSTKETEKITDIVTNSFMDAADYLAENFKKKPASWKWGYLHQITLKHPLSEVDALDKIFKLNRGPFSVSGSYHTIAPFSYPLFTADNIIHGASHRHIYSTASWDSTQSVIPTGNSGHVKSEFYMDQTDLYINGEYHDDPFSAEAVQKAEKYKLLLLPLE
jgi:penicillin amidase